MSTTVLEDRHVAKTQLPSGVRVSTIFIDYIHRWETIVFGGPHDSEGEQYESLEDARAGHELWVMVAQGVLTPEAIYEMREVTPS